MCSGARRSSGLAAFPGPAPAWPLQYVCASWCDLSKNSSTPAILPSEDVYTLHRPRMAGPSGVQPATLWALKLAHAAPSIQKPVPTLSCRHLLQHTSSAFLTPFTLPQVLGSELQEGWVFVQAWAGGSQRACVQK